MIAIRYVKKRASVRSTWENALEFLDKDKEIPKEQRNDFPTNSDMLL